MASRTGVRGLDRHLLRGEKLVVVIRRSRIVLAKPLALALLGAALALWIDLNVSSDSGEALVRLAWAAALAVLGWFAWRWLEWRRERFVVTDKRLLLYNSLVTRNVPMMPLPKVTDMTFNQSIMGRIFRYGSFVLESAGQSQGLSRVDYIPDPDENYRLVVAEVFGLGDEEGTHEGEDWAEEPEPPRRRSFRGIIRRGDDPVDEQPQVESPIRDYAAPYGPHVVATTRKRPVTSFYRSSDRDRSTVDDTGELPPYDPDWRP